MKLATMLDPPYDTKGKRDTGQRDHPGDAAHDDERLDPSAAVRPTARSFENPSEACSAILKPR